MQTLLPNYLNGHPAIINASNGGLLHSFGIVCGARAYPCNPIVFRILLQLHGRGKFESVAEARQFQRRDAEHTEHTEFQDDALRSKRTFLLSVLCVSALNLPYSIAYPRGNSIVVSHPP
jgi:hypothetical protein